MRADERLHNQLRPLVIKTDVNKHAEGSVWIECGDTVVLCTATIEERVPPFMKGQGKGWVHAEYAMLPRATQHRNQRESARGKIGGRTMEIQRLIGRALRSVVDLHALGERSVTLDCDVIQADGGTRTTSITGAFVAMCIALHKLVQAGTIKQMPVRDFLASVSVGVVNGDALLDLNYVEDSSAKVDMNVVMTGAGEYVEVQGTGEDAPFSKDEFHSLLELAEHGIDMMIAEQRRVLQHIGDRIGSGNSR